MNLDETRAVVAALSLLPKQQRGVVLSALTAWALAHYDEQGNYIPPMPKT